MPGDLVFRVEQLDPPNRQALKPEWKWRAISTHAGDEPFESFGPALDDAIVKQARLKEKIKLAQHQHRMAMVRAQEAAS